MNKFETTGTADDIHNTPRQYDYHKSEVISRSCEKITT